MVEGIPGPLKVDRLLDSYVAGAVNTLLDDEHRLRQIKDNAGSPEEFEQALISYREEMKVRKKHKRTTK